MGEIDRLRNSGDRHLPQIESLFSNHTWTKDPSELTVDEWDHLR